MSKMINTRLKDYIDINPTVKLCKGQVYPCIEMEKISVGVKRANDEEAAVYTGQSCSKFQPNDTLMARITPCLENGKIAKYVNENAGFGSTEFFVLRAQNGLSTDEYVYYLAQTRYVRDLAVNSMTGASGRQRADAKFIGKIKWEFPDISTQNKITSILSAYDNLIENNNKRIKLLEQMAENLYKEWFVRFRFPGHENTEFENGFPKGWVIKRLHQFGRIETGKTPSKEDDNNYGGDIMFVKTPDMHNNIFVLSTEEYLSLEGHKSQPKKLLPENSIMVSCIGTGGVVAINAKPAHTNQQINSIILNNINNIEWLYFVCKNLKEMIEMFGATGSTMTNLSKGKFERLKIMTPPQKIIFQYHELVNGIFSEIKALLQCNDALVKQRDLLLPRLMSGKLEV